MRRSRSDPRAHRLLITADAGGSSGARLRLWKVELQQLADELKLPISVCHLPPGTSKWNKIEHRLFSFISQNWRSTPLVSHEVIVNLIASTTTKTGPRVRSRLDTQSYPAGVKVSRKELEAVKLRPDPFHGDWNYTILPNGRAVSRQPIIWHNYFVTVPNRTSRRGSRRWAPPAGGCRGRP